MKKIGVSLLLIVATFLIINTSTKSWADDTISILNYSLKPVGYVSGDRFIQSIWNLELKNNDATPRNFSIKVVFYDKDKNELKQITKDANMKASETKKFSDAVLLEPAMAKQVATTKAFIENL